MPTACLLCSKCEPHGPLNKNEFNERKNMKQIKKFGATIGMIVAAAAALLIATPASASPQSIRFIADGIANITVSNGIPYYNLKSVGANPTNAVGLSWTNAYGSNIVVSATNNTTTVLTRSVNFWGEQIFSVLPADDCISCTYVAGAGNTTTNLLIFAPVYDGTNEATDFVYVWPLIANGTTVQTAATNNFIGKFPAGTQKVRLKNVYDGTNAAAGQFTILDLRLNGFPP